MAVKAPENTEFRRWINTIALGFISLMCSSIYLKIETDHDHISDHDKLIYGHEIRITSLEGNKGESPKKISMLLSPAMLPENKFFTNENKKQWNFSNK